MKYLFVLPATILLTTVLGGSLFFRTFAQTPESSKQTSPTFGGTEVPVESDRKDSPNSDAFEVPTLPEEKTSPIPNGTEAPVDPKQPNSPTGSGDETKAPAAPQAKQGAYIGIQMIVLTPKIAQEFNNDPSSNLKVPETEGMLIVKVFPNSPAETAGLRRGDIITEISGKVTTDAKEVIEIVNNRDVGESLPLKVTRGNETDSISVRLGEKPPEEAEN